MLSRSQIPVIKANNADADMSNADAFFAVPIHRHGYRTQDTYGKMVKALFYEFGRV